MRKRGSFLEHRMRVKVEGFDQQRILTQLLSAGIVLQKIQVISEIEMDLDLMAYDWERFRKLLGNRFRITVLRERGMTPLFRRLLARRVTLAGLLLFGVMLIYQNSFVSEIQIQGYERLKESDIRHNLREAGLYEGCPKSVDLDHVEALMYGKLDNISYIGIKYTGNMAEVTVVEGTGKPKYVDLSTPCHIVADREGYLERIIPKEGVPVKEKGMFVRPGDIVISGVVPVEDRTNGTISYRNVHADGEVYVKALYRRICYQPRKDLIQVPTGQKSWGISLETAHRRWSTAELFWRYDTSVLEKKELLQISKPFLFRLSLTCAKEVKLYRKDRSEKEIQALGETQAREIIRKEIPDSAQILKKSLKFSPEENIIEVSIMLEALEQIGKPQIFNGSATGSAINGSGVQTEGGT